MRKCRRNEFLEGQKFNRLLVIDYIRRTDHGTYVCKCDCGNVSEVRPDDLKAGRVVSCGCYQAELVGNRCRKHGKYRSRTYRVWAAMKSRCLYSGSTFYHRYGGRGIRVCERWMDFENFYLDMGDAPNGYSIDRINNNGDYEPLNCRWANQIQQSNNMERNKFIEFNGEKLTYSQWARKTGLKTHIVRYRHLKGLTIAQMMEEKNG